MFTCFMIYGRGHLRREVRCNPGKKYTQDNSWKNRNVSSRVSIDGYQENGDNA